MGQYLALCEKANFEQHRRLTQGRSTEGAADRPEVVGKPAAAGSRPCFYIDCSYLTKERSLFSTARSF